VEHPAALVVAAVLGARVVQSLVMVATAVQVESVGAVETVETVPTVPTH
jgi:hypothetical protein